jgi:DnaK suppressor protein
MNTATRSTDLRQILIERRRELQDDVQNRIREGRIDQRHDVGDHVDFALLQMRAQTLTRISEALIRLEAGNYGTCLSCECEITKRRLRALPFAVRCQECEEKRELAQRDRARHHIQPRDSFSLFPDVIGCR